MSLKWGCEIIWRIILISNTFRVRTLKGLRDFIGGNESFDLEPVSRLEAYRFIEQPWLLLATPTWVGGQGRGQDLPAQGDRPVAGATSCSSRP